MKKLIIPLALLLAGCAPSGYIKKGVTQEQYTKDLFDCKQMAGSTAGQNPFIYNSVMKDCMVNKHGYQLE